MISLLYTWLLYVNNPEPVHLFKPRIYGFQSLEISRPHYAFIILTMKEATNEVNKSKHMCKLA